jgi:HPt (histidine-containing phosphotransfer) domain-containing protein
MAELNTSQREELQQIRQRFARSVPEKVRALEEAARLLAADGSRAEAVERLFHQAHRLAGSAAIFGLKELSEAAARLEQLVASPPEEPGVEASWLESVREALRGIRQAAAR